MLPTQYQPYAIFLILVLAMISFMLRKWSYATTSIFALSASILIGAVPVDQTFTGLINPAVITVASVMIITHIIAKSNVLNMVINKIDTFSHSKTMHVFIFSFYIAFLSAFMNNVGALGLMLPISIYTSLKNNRSPSYILMPIAMASALGGMITLIGTPPNLIISNFRAQAVGTPFSMFDFGYVGLYVALFGVLFIGVLGWRLLPKKSIQQSSPKRHFTFEIRIPPKSQWIGNTLKALKEEMDEDIEITGMLRRKKKHPLYHHTEIKSGDRFIIEATVENIEEFNSTNDIVVANSIRKGKKNSSSNDIMLEVIVPTNSQIKGKSFNDTNLRSQYKIAMIAISQPVKNKVVRIRELIIQPGDVMLLQCKDPNIIDRLPFLGVVPIQESTFQIKTTFKHYVPILIFALAIILVSCSILPAQVGFAAAAFLMILFDSTALTYVTERFDWSIIILLAAVIPIGDALTQTGGSDLLANLILGVAKDNSILITIAIILVITMFLSDFINNAATSIVMAPIAISLAKSLNVSVDPFLMAVAIGASCAFLSPIGHQNNLMVMGPGRYKFFDYMRIGLPLEIIVFIVATPLIYVLWYLR